MTQRNATIYPKFFGCMGPVIVLHPFQIFTFYYPSDLISLWQEIRTEVKDQKSAQWTCLEYIVNTPRWWRSIGRLFHVLFPLCPDLGHSGAGFLQCQSCSTESRPIYLPTMLCYSGSSYHYVTLIKRKWILVVLDWMMHHDGQSRFGVSLRIGLHSLYLPKK